MAESPMKLTKRARGTKDKEQGGTFAKSDKSNPAAEKPFNMTMTFERHSKLKMEAVKRGVYMKDIINDFIDSL